jgi:hypothetical protein
MRQTAKLTNKMIARILDSLGYAPDAWVINAALTEYKGEKKTSLLRLLKIREDQFRAAGSRGVELAEEIDRLRIAIACRKIVG